MTVIRMSDLEARPWKNGGGITWEIAAEGSQPPAWRLSVALIDRSGAFSDYAGYDRTIVSIDGGPVELTVDGARVPLRHGEPFAFRGEASVTGELLGEAARDLNVMTRRGRFNHDVKMIASPERLALESGTFAFIFVMRGNVWVGPTLCAADETACIDASDGEVKIEPEAGSSACVARLWFVA